MRISHKWQGHNAILNTTFVLRQGATVSSFAKRMGYAIYAVLRRIAFVALFLVAIPLQ